MDNLKKTYSVVAFIDILGYKDLVEKSINERKELELFADLQSALNFSKKKAIIFQENAIKVLGNVLGGKEQVENRIISKQFSDNIYISFDYTSDSELYDAIFFIASIACNYQRFMLDRGYFVRGGIAHGFNKIDENFIFSIALIEAVKVEKETCYPRISLHKNTMNTFIKEGDNPYKKLTQDLFVQDWAGTTFLNPFLDISKQKESTFDILEEKLSNIIKENTQPDSEEEFDKKFNARARNKINSEICRFENNPYVHTKYLWLKNLLDWVEHKQDKVPFQFI